jgi:hypothetical protein
VKLLSNLDDFKDIADDMLKDIVVSEDLKKRTIEKCKKETSSKRKFITRPAAVGVAAALALVILNFNRLPLGTEKAIDSPGIMMEAAGDSGNSTMVKTTEPSNDGSLSPDSGVSNDMSTLQATAETGETSPAQSTEPYEGTGKPLYEPGTLEAAEKYMGSKFKLPQYVPSNYQLGMVQVPTDMSKEGMDIMVSFEGNNKFFTITMRKGVSTIDNFVGSKEIDINGAKAEITSGALMAGSEEAAPAYTQLRWISDNVLYILEGEITEEEAVKVAKLIK